jgi:cytochrome c-type biogenesis protein CcmH/NrfF
MNTLENLPLKADQFYSEFCNRCLQKRLFKVTEQQQSATAAFARLQCIVCNGEVLCHSNKGTFCVRQKIY